MIRSELPSDQLIIGYLNQFGRVGEIDGLIRIKWILVSAEATQIDDDELILRTTKVKNKTL